MNDLEGHTDDFDIGSVLYYYCIFSQSLTVFFFSLIFLPYLEVLILILVLKIDGSMKKINICE